jgi:hypothetical protein
VKEHGARHQPRDGRRVVAEIEVPAPSR